MFICEILLFDWYFPEFCKFDMSKYGYLEVFQRSLRLGDNDSRLIRLQQKWTRLVKVTSYINTPLFIL